MFASLFRCGFLGRLLVAVGASSTALVILAGIQLASAQATAELFDYPVTALDGTVSAKVVAPLQACRSLCSSRSGCVGFDHSSEGSICRLFSIVGSAHQSLVSTAAARNLIAGYRPPSNPPVAPAATPAVQPKRAVAHPEPPDVSGRKITYRTIPGDPRPIGWVYINVCSGAPVDAESLRRSINDYVFESLRLIPGRIEQFDRDTTPQCTLVPKAIGYSATNAGDRRIGAALEELGSTLRPLGIGTRPDGMLPMQGSDRYRIDIWLSHQ
ncbi:hypothetical protein NKJ36_19930 [Mesorhizobium sp. M0142]|uniref:hypothetical protein n=1 Tax=unclassified Mesorhizobium TaxID=325217 RepID=UPI00333A34EB